MLHQRLAPCVCLSMTSAWVGRKRPEGFVKAARSGTCQAPPASNNSFTNGSKFSMCGPNKTASLPITASARILPALGKGAFANDDDAGKSLPGLELARAVDRKEASVAAKVCGSLRCTGFKPKPCSAAITFSPAFVMPWCHQKSKLRGKSIEAIGTPSASAASFRRGCWRPATAVALLAQFDSEFPGMPAPAPGPPPLPCGSYFDAAGESDGDRNLGCSWLSSVLLRAWPHPWSAWVWCTRQRLQTSTMVSQ